MMMTVMMVIISAHWDSGREKKGKGERLHRREERREKRFFFLLLLRILVRKNKIGPVPAATCLLGAYTRLGFAVAI